MGLLTYVGGSSWLVTEVTRLVSVTRACDINPGYSVLTYNLVQA